METHIHNIIESLLSVAIILPVLMFFISRAIKQRDNNEGLIKDELKKLTTSLTKLETEVMLLGKDIKNEEFERRLRDLNKEIRIIQNDCSKNIHWITNSFMKIDNRMSKIDNKDMEFDEPPRSQS